MPYFACWTPKKVNVSLYKHEMGVALLEYEEKLSQRVNASQLAPRPDLQCHDSAFTNNNALFMFTTVYCALIHFLSYWYVASPPGSVGREHPVRNCINGMSTNSSKETRNNIIG